MLLVNVSSVRANLRSRDGCVSRLLLYFSSAVKDNGVVNRSRRFFVGPVGRRALGFAAAITLVSTGLFVTRGLERQRGRDHVVDGVSR
jgi:hypothetical protein